MATKTRYPELQYEKTGSGWSFVDASTGAVIGLQYPSRDELLSDMERFYNSRFLNGRTEWPKHSDPHADEDAPPLFKTQPHSAHEVYLLMDMAVNPQTDHLNRVFMIRESGKSGVEISMTGEEILNFIKQIQPHLIPGFVFKELANGIPATENHEALEAESAGVSRIDMFMAAYENNFRAAFEKNPRSYRFGADKIPTVCSKMREALLSDSFPTPGDGANPALESTCTQFGIVLFSRKALKAFLDYK